MGQSTILTGPFSIAFCMFTRGYGNHGSCGKTTAKVGSKFWSVVLVILGFLGMVLLYIWFTTLSIYYINYIILFYFILYCIVLYYIIYSILYHIHINTGFGGIVTTFPQRPRKW